MAIKIDKNEMKWQESNFKLKFNPCDEFYFFLRNNYKIKLMITKNKAKSARKDIAIILIKIY